MLKNVIEIRYWRSNSCFTAIVLCFALLCALSVTSGEAATIYVDSDASGSGDGASWVNAITDLNEVINSAGDGDEIWVAAGSYSPTDTADRAISFTLKDGVALYGGFAGTETSREERNPSVNVTVLTGDIGDLNVSSDNSYHVIYCENVDDTALIDGFTITGGNADGTDFKYQVGGGMYNKSSSPAVTACTFTGNRADSGGAMFNEVSVPVVTNCIFSSNRAKAGGAMFIWELNPVVRDCTFTGNMAVFHGGAMENYLSNPEVSNCTFVENSTGDFGGAIQNGNSRPVVINCTFTKNSADKGGAMYNFSRAYPKAINCTFSANRANDGGAIYNDNSNPVIKNCILWGNSGKEITNYNGSTPDVSYCVISGDYAGTNIISSDPMLGVLADNGGFTWTCALEEGSPAIDAGFTLNIVSKDQRGLARSQGSSYDIGAYEYGGFFLTVAKNGTGTGEVSPNVFKHFYLYGKVTLTATAAMGSVFAGWSGDLSGDAPSTSVTMDEDKQITATFNRVAPDPAGSLIVPDSSAALDSLVKGTVSLDLPDELSGVSFESFGSSGVTASSKLNIILSGDFEDIPASSELDGNFITGISFDLQAGKSPAPDHIGVVPLDVTLIISKDKLSVFRIEAVEKGEKGVGITETFLDEVEILKVIGSKSYNLIDIVRGTSRPLSDFFSITQVIQEESEKFHITFGLLVVDAVAGDSSPVQPVTINGDCRFMVFDGRRDGRFTDPLVAVEKFSATDETASSGGGCSATALLPGGAFLLIPLLFLSKKK